MLCEWVYTVLKRTEGKLGASSCPQHFHKDTKCALKGAGRRNLFKLNFQERSSLETNKDTGMAFKDCQISFCSGTCHVVHTSLVTQGSQKKKSHDGDAMQRRWAFCHFQVVSRCFGSTHRQTGGEGRGEIELQVFS